MQALAAWMATPLALVLATVTGRQARAATYPEPSAKGGAGTLKLAGEAETYVWFTPASPLTLTFRGPGELTLKLRSVLPSGQPASDAPQVLIQRAGEAGDRVTLSIFPAPGKTFAARDDRIPGGAAKDRRLTIEDGSPPLTLSALRGEAALALRWRGKLVPPRRRETSAVTRRDRPEAARRRAVAEATVAVPLTGPIEQPTIAAAPLVADQPPAAASAQPAAPAATPTAALAPPAREPVANAATAAPATAGGGLRILPLALLGGAVLCAVSSGVAVGIAVGQNDSYLGAPEARAGLSTNRSGTLGAANGALAAAEVLGLAASVLLVAAGLSLVF